MNIYIGTPLVCGVEVLGLTNQEKKERDPPHSPPEMNGREKKRHHFVETHGRKHIIFV